MKTTAAAACATAFLLPCAAWAEPGLATEIYGPDVARGEGEVAVRGGVLDGGDADGEWQTKIEAGFAFTDFWRPSIVAEWEHEGGDTEFTAVAIENVFDFAGTREWPVHFGAYVEYEVNAHDGPDGLELKLLMQRERGPLALTLNLIGEREIGQSSSDTWEFGYAAEGAFALNEDFAFGIQGFGDAGTDDDLGHFGDHAHYWGPFVQFELAHIGDGEVELQLGYLVGSGESEADGQFRFKLEYEFGDDD
ncbi:MAG: hypothetical protein R3C27_08615 [Hyphomonadaceae bacterium]